MPPKKNVPATATSPEPATEIQLTIDALLKRIAILESQVAAIPSLTTRLDTAQVLIKDLQDQIEEIGEGGMTPDSWRAARVTKFGHIHPIDETPDVNGDDKTSVEEAIQHARNAGKRFNDEVIAVLPVWNH